jgi:phospholipid/cholesterol/gamma-HCH transport system substrate-binding protein
MATKGDPIRLGLFVLAGTAVLVVGLYLLGSKRDLFRRTVQVEAVFQQVGGLRPGNNVRYMGINVGTVERIEILNDTAVRVLLSIREADSDHIRADAVATVGTDGLMGNRLVNLEPGPLGGPPITDGTRLATRAALDTDAMMQTLGRTSRNLEEITEQVQILARNMNSPGNTVDLFTDTMLARDLAATVANLRMAAAQARELTGGLHGLALDVKAGKGTLGLLLADTATATQAKFMLNNLASLSDSVQAATNSLGRFTSQLNQPGGTAHALTTDTAMSGSLRRTIMKLDTGTTLLNEDLRALQRNWFFRRYFKEKARKE